jgi:16S rRNA (guanine1207-N2)-methyltransferase
MNPTTFGSSLENFELLRRPQRHSKSLRAWDAADEYLLDSLQLLKSVNHRVLLINDQFGALALPLYRSQICSWSDSRTAHMALLENIARNHLDAFAPMLLPGTEIPDGPFDTVLWRIPKTLALFEQQSNALRRCTGPGTTVLAGGMLKHLPEKIYESLAALGAVEVLPARKKARVFCIEPNDQTIAATATPEKSLVIPELELTLRAGANVFARDKFDIGARFFIEQFAQLPRSERIADLGCGNGILGIVAQRQQPWAAIEFFDDSYQAIAAATANYHSNNVDNLAPAAQFHVDDVFASYDGTPFDLILCNPPFHQGHVIGDQIAWQMFAQSRRHLRKSEGHTGGELWIVGNRHLQYHIALKKIFGNCRRIASNAKFVILAARVE